MKMNITYGADDIKRAIRHDLARQGIPVEDLEIKYTKGAAVVTINVTVDETVPAPAAVRVVAPSQPVLPPLVPPSTQPAASFEVIDGGNAPVDMSGLLQASAKIARSTEGKFPTPKHNMIDGESSEWPGPKDE